MFVEGAVGLEKAIVKRFPLFIKQNLQNKESLIDLSEHGAIFSFRVAKRRIDPQLLDGCPGALRYRFQKRDLIRAPISRLIVAQPKGGHPTSLAHQWYRD